MKPTKLKLEPRDELIIRRIYMQLVDDWGEIGGPEMWTAVIMEFLDHKGYRLEKTDGKET